jgi:hypothetical protein
MNYVVDFVVSERLIEQLCLEIAQLSGYGHIQTLPVFLYDHLEQQLLDPTHGELFFNTLTTIMCYEDFHYALFTNVSNWYVTTIQSDSNHLLISQWLKEHSNCHLKFNVQWFKDQADIYIEDYDCNFFDNIVF